MLEKPTDKRIMTMSVMGLTFPLCFYIMVAFFGYSVYGENVEDDLLKNITTEYIGLPLFMLTFGAIMAASALTYPIYFFEARNLWLFSINVCLGKRSIMEKEIPTTTLIETR